jgi:hypothetical protein
MSYSPIQYDQHGITTAPFSLADQTQVYQQREGHSMTWASSDVQEPSGPQWNYVDPNVIEHSLSGSYVSPTLKEKASASSFSTTPRPIPPRDGSWTFEIVTIVLSLGAVGSICAVLAHYNDNGLPEWPNDITLNTIIALLATAANAAMTVSIQSGLSQFKWIRFKLSRAPLSDMEAFDEASRGTWGAVKLLVTGRGG